MKLRLSIFGFALAHLVTFHAAAQTVRTWTGATSNSWATGTNWSTAPVYAGSSTRNPTSGDPGSSTDIFEIQDTEVGGPITLNFAGSGSGLGTLLTLGGINFSKTNATASTIRSSGTTNGTFRLDGATINGVPKTLINLSGSANLTIAPNGANTAVLTLQLGIYDGVINVDTSRTLTISSAVSEATASSGFTKTGPGAFLLSGTNTYTGTTTVSAGSFFVNGDSSGATGAVSVSNGARFGGSGTVGGATTISGRHSAGGTQNTVGTQTFSSTLAYETGSIFEWDLNAASTSSGFDKVTATGGITVTGSPTFNVVLGTSAAQTSAFWTAQNTTKEWALSDIFGSNPTGNFATNVTVTNATPGFLSAGSFSITSTNLVWTTVPEPSSALTGLLLGAGLLRRRSA